MLCQNHLPRGFQSKHISFILFSVSIMYLNVIHSVAQFCKIEITVANCSNRNWLRIPQNLSESVKYLDLSNNKISVIAPLSFRNLRDLRQLDLSNNAIRSIGRGIFRNLPNLRKLNLRGNSLTYLYLEGLVSLEILDLSNNTIRSIGRGTFRNLPNLRKLNLRGNRMLSFNDGGFEDLVSLEILDFGENNLYSVDPKTFKKMISLQQLYLDHNRMLTSLARVQLPKLSKYTLNGTQVKCNCSLQAYLKQFQETWGRPLNIDIACSINMSLTNWKKKCQDFLGKELKCYKCDGRGCSEPNATFCQHDSDVCMSKISATDDIQRIEKSCSPAKKCFRAEINNINTCKFNSNKYACTICCTDQRCNFNRYKGWLRRFQLMLTFHIDKDFSSDSENERSMNYSYLARNISRILVDELHKYHGIFNIRVNFLRRPEDTVDIECSVAIGCTVLTDIKEDIVWHWINHTVTTSKQFDYLNVKKNTVYLRGEMICNANETRLKGRYMWPVTTVGTTIKLPCKTNNNTASRTCYRMPMHLEMAEQRQVPPQWMTGYWSLPNMSLCEDADWIRKSLLNINSDDIDEDDIDDSSLKLENVTKSAVYFQERDIAIYVDILEKMIPLVPAIPANTTSQYILGSINNIIGAPEKILVKAESSNNSANRILKGLGRIDNKFPLEDELQEFTVCYSRVGIGISRVEAHQFNGLTYSTSTKQNTIYNMSYNPEEMLLEQTDFISLPASLLDNLTGEEKSSISRIVFHHLTDDKLFRVIQKSENTTGQRVLGQVLTSDVPNIRITSLKDPILIAFNLLNMTDMKNMKPQCVYWDNLSKEKSHWSDNGCIVQTYIPGKNVTCACNHLTSFAIILNIYDSNVPQEHMEIQSVISNISCAISLACLVFTIVIYVSSKILRKGIFAKILINLCISLAIVNFIFLVGMQPYATKYVAVCKMIAALLHYFLLVSLIWMAVEAFNIYMSIVVVFQDYLTNFLLRSSIAAWGLPAIIVVLTLAINKSDNYVYKAEVCWLSRKSLYVAFLFPVMVIVLFNITLFSLIIHRLIALREERKFANKNRKIRLAGIVGVFFLLGLSWILAFFTFDVATVVFQYLFVIFNTLQGLFIFIFYCMYKKESREIIYEYFRRHTKWCRIRGSKYRDAPTSSKDNEIKTHSTSKSDSDKGTPSTYTSSVDGKISTKF